MQQCSFEDECMEIITFTCRCISPNLYFCDDHFIKHMKTPGNHASECVVIQSDPNQIRKLIPEVKDLIKDLRLRRNRIMNNTKILIECIERKTWKTLNNIKEVEKASIDLISERMISKENYERIQSLLAVHDDNDESDEIDKITKSINSLYDFYIGKVEGWKECNQIIFSTGAGGLEVIDLNTLKKSNLSLVYI